MYLTVDQFFFSLMFFQCGSSAEETKHLLMQLDISKCSKLLDSSDPQRSDVETGLILFITVDLVK